MSEQTPPADDAPLIAPRPRTGRPPKRTRARVDRMLTLLRGGSTRTAAAGAAGIDRRQMQRWMRSSAAFRRAVEEAEDSAAVFYENTIRKAATEAERTYHYDRDGKLLREVVKYDWRAAAWWLEHRRRPDWAEGTAQVEVTVAGTVDHHHGWDPDRPFALGVIGILQRAGKLPEGHDDDIAVALLSPPEPVPAGGDPVDPPTVEPD